MGGDKKYQMDVYVCMCDLTSAFITLEDAFQDKTNAIKQQVNKMSCRQTRVFESGFEQRKGETMLQTSDGSSVQSSRLIQKE